MARYEWLSNPTVLNYADNLRLRIEYIKIIILDDKDRPIKAIEGRATAGSVTVNGSSAVRRAGSLTLVTEPNGASITEAEAINEITQIDNLISINKRCLIEVGYENNEGEFPEYNIFWFPLGTFAILNASLSYSVTQGITISLSLKDKMALLNGELGGIIPIGLTHSPILNTTAPEEEWTVIEDSASGHITKYPPEKGVLFRELIKTLATDFGELAQEKVIIEDIPVQTKNIVRWQSSLKNLVDKDVGATLDNLYIYTLSSVDISSDSLE